jgi:hypothetical protein
MTAQMHEHKPEPMGYSVFLFWNAIMFSHDCVQCNRKISANAKYKVYSCLVLAMCTAVFLIVRKYFNGPHNIEGVAALIAAYFVQVSANYVIFKRAGFHIARKARPFK